MNSIIIKGTDYPLPMYLPDATRGVVKSLSSEDLVGSGVKGVVVNTFHLLETPGSKVLAKYNGVKKFMNFGGLVVSDSGGWQVFSLIKRFGRPGRITDDGVVFGKQDILTPEKSVQMQFEINSDIVICLDDFSAPYSDRATVLNSVERTTLWARRSKEEYLRQLSLRGLTLETGPKLVGVVQGAEYKDLRKKSYEELAEIGFDGFGFGGYPIDQDGNLDKEISEYLSGLLPTDKFWFALGLGRPEDIIFLRKLGWDIFDCTLPTRDARHGRLYLFDEKNAPSFLYINRAKFSEDALPIDADCDCLICKNYSKAYLHHLFKIGDFSYYRLSSVHNIRFYTRLMEHLT